MGMGYSMGNIWMQPVFLKIAIEGQIFCGIQRIGALVGTDPSARCQTEIDIIGGQDISFTGIMI